MLHNQKVHDAVARLEQRSDAAENEMDLVNIIQVVAADRKGSLEYKDTGWKVGAAVVALTGLITILLGMGIHQLDVTYLVLGPVLNYSYCWLPVLIITSWVLWREESGKPFRLMSFIADPLYRVFALGAILTLLTGGIPEWQVVYWEGIFWLAGLTGTVPEFVLGMLMLLSGGYRFLSVLHRSGWRDRLTANIRFKDGVMDTGLTEVKAKHQPSTEQLKKDFREFKRGNYSRNLEKMYAGEYLQDGVSFPYRVYQYHYVNRRTTTSTDSKGNTTTRTVYDHYDRYGVLLSFPMLREVCFSCDGNVSGYGSRIRKNIHNLDDVFRVYTDRIHELQNFLNTEKARLLTAFASEKHNVVIEANERSELCIAFDDNIFETSHQHSLDDAGAFAREVAGDSTFPALQRVLTLVHDLLHY